MKLVRVTTTGHKGARWSVDLKSDCTFIRAPNGAGKSRIAEAILMSLTGKHPTAGTGHSPTSSGEAIMRMAVGDRSEVSTEWASASGQTVVVTRLWRRERKVVKGKPTIKFPRPKLIVTTHLGETIRGKDATSYLGRHFGESSLFDGETLTGAKSSSTARRKLLFQFMHTEWTEQTAWERVADLGTDEETVRALFDRENIDRGIVLRPCSGSVVDWLKRNHLALATMAGHDRLALKAAEAALEKADTDNVDAHEQAEAKARLDDLRARYDAAVAATEKKATEAATAQAEAKALQDRRERLQAEIRKIKTEIAKQPRAEDLAGLIAEKTDNDKAIAEAQTEIDRLQAEIKDLAAKSNAAMQRAKAAEDDFVEAQAEATDARDAAAAIDVSEGGSALAALLGVVEAAEQQFAVATCPTCGQGLDHDAVFAAAAADKDAADRIQTKRERLAKRAERKAATAAAASAELSDARRQVSQQHRAEMLARTQLDDVRDDLRRRTVYGDKIASQINAASAVDGASSDLPEKLEKATQVLAALPQVDIAALTGATIRSIRAQAQEVYDGLREQIDAATRELRAIDRRLQRKQDLETLRAQALEIAEWAEKSSAAAKAFGPTGLQEMILQEGLAPFVDAVTSCLPADRRPFRVSLVDAYGSPDCVFEIRTDAGMIPVESLSRGEWEPVQAAIMAGARILADSEWRGVVLDGVETVSYANRQALFAALGDLVDSGKLSQALVLGCPDSADCPDGWAVQDDGR